MIIKRRGVPRERKRIPVGITVFLLLTLILFARFACLPDVFVYAEKPWPETAADAAVLIDAKSGAVLYDKNMHKPKYPASTTKVLTGLLAVENLDFSGVVTIDAETPFTKGSRIYLLEGERVTVEQLFNAMLVESANDAAVAIAREISGSVEAFAGLMNQRAKELGALNTHFVNPNGLENEEHTTSPYDLALFAVEAMKHEKFRKAVSTYHYYMPPTNLQDERFLYNSNRLLYDESRKVIYEGQLRPCKYEGVTGIKTGYTAQAGSCLVAGAERDGMELIAVIMESPGNNLYSDAISLLEYGFADYKSLQAFEAGTAQDVQNVKRGAVRTVRTETGASSWITLPVSANADELSIEPVYNENLRAPINKGDQVGEIAAYYKGEKLGDAIIVASETVSEGGFLSIFGVPDAVALWLGAILAGVFFLLFFAAAIFILLKRRQIRHRKRRRKERAARYAHRRKEEEDFLRDIKGRTDV
ncbi:MAG: D-alanyl-D-alanine carboxypeptidase [Clostridiales Family XIII bacterium]|jgi:D-alanyl-D-alanine carboxypeptidase (penicillin-binding protein 5/6)|nr:D-alanyl-D-alanine carboxypeptidase [Clostridiales Family XIII bacterium]